MKIDPSSINSTNYSISIILKNVGNKTNPPMMSHKLSLEPLYTETNTTINPSPFLNLRALDSFKRKQISPLGKGTSPI